MPRVIAIDFGLKRTGLAVTDPLRIIASALETVESAKLMDFLVAYCSNEVVDGFVLGLPTNLDGSATDITANAQALAEEIGKRFPEKFIELMDERFTSRMARQVLNDSGKGRMARREKGQLDRISATILLQGWLERNSR
ncbi:MAG: Holliday junction resolvase RuvX [Flavobacteriales bacterium]|nr:Holliday junction resolvase RuvX [Flavobacteriales bacterium]